MHEEKGGSSGRIETIRNRNARNRSSGNPDTAERPEKSSVLERQSRYINAAQKNMQPKAVEVVQKVDKRNKWKDECETCGTWTSSDIKSCKEFLPWSDMLLAKCSPFAKAERGD